MITGQIISALGCLRLSVPLVVYKRISPTKGLSFKNLSKNITSPLKTKSQFAQPVIPDERRFAGRDPESSESDAL
jgi:hypothetical protein